MKRRQAISVVLIASILLFSPILSHIDILEPILDSGPFGEAVAALTPTTPIVIEGNGDLLTNPLVSSGSGTTLDPYVISDYSINAISSGRGGIAIRNTTAHLVVRNITVQVGNSAVGILLYPLYSGGWQWMNIILENITITGGSTQIYLYSPIQVIVKDCTFNNPSISGNVIYSYYGRYTYFDNNTFNCPNMDVDLDYTYSFGFTDNKGIMRNYDDRYFRYSNFANNTLEVTSLKFYTGYFSDFQGNDLSGRSPSTNLVTFIDCNRIKIANNTLEGGYDTIYISHPNSYNPVRTNYPKWGSFRIENNHINGSANRGIYFYWVTGHPAITYVNIVFNRFTNTTSYAISVLGGGSPTSYFWHNRFENNHGSGDIYAAQTAQARDRYGQCSWDNGVIGNYWKDKRAPDDDNDGYIDESYELDSVWSSTDQLPVSNPHFDFEKPYLQIIRPGGRFFDHSYLNLTWNVMDNHSGMKKMEIRNGFQPWIDVSQWDHYALDLVQGQYKLIFRATDRALLQSQVEIDISINRTLLPFVVRSPLEGEFFNDTSVDVSWSLQEDFVPFNLSYSVDSGSFIDMGSVAPFQINTNEGRHDLNLRFYDHYGNIISKAIEFICDLTDPDVSILYPAQGSVISNDLVNFQWDQSDEFGISTTYAKIDDGPLIEKENSYFSELLSDGPHTLQIIVIDNAGNTEEDVLSFVISRNTSLNIISPRLTDPTSVQYHTIKWEYLTANLVIGSLSIILDNENPLTLPNSALQHEIFLSSDGLHRITVKAFDIAGNVVSDTIEVIVDRTPPAPAFQNLMDGAYLNMTNIDLTWNAVERWGVDHFDLYFDGMLKGSGLKQGSFSLDVVPGVHVLKVVAVDRAGNIGEKEITVTIDIDHPGLKLIEPNTNILTDVYTSFSWEGTDDFGIDHYNFTLDSRPIEELGTATSRQLLMTEGEHTFILRCVDLAGNVRSIVKEFTVDLTDPVVIFNTELPEFIASFNGLLEWEITEDVGVDSIDLTINGIEYQVSPDARYFTVELNKGIHEVHILVTDISGRTDEKFMIFTIDPDPPELVKDDKDVIVDGSKATIYWVLNEEKDNLTGSLFLDGSKVNIGMDLDDGSFLFAELSPGNHTAIITVVDRAGNEREVAWDFIIEKEKKSGPSAGGLGIGGVVMIILLVLILLLGIFGFFMYKNRKPEKEEKKIAAPKRPDKLSFGPTPVHQAKPTSHQQHPHHHHAPKAPQIHSPHAASTHDVGHGYIRPESKKGNVQRKIIDAPEPRKEPAHMEHSGRHKQTESRKEPEEKVDEWGDVEDWEEVDEIEEWDDMEDL